MKQNILIVAICLFVGGCANFQDSAKDSSEFQIDTLSNTVSVRSDDTETNLAIEKAKLTLAIFDSAFSSGNPLFENFAVKKRFLTRVGDGEHIWINVLTKNDSGYQGIINNDPEDTNEVRFGDTVFVAKGEVTDWMFVERNELRGGYTIRAIRAKLSREERVQFDESLGFKISD